MLNNQAYPFQQVIYSRCMRLCIMYMYGPWIASFIAQVIQWVKDTGSSHVEITTPSVNEQEAQEMLGGHRTFMETDATVSYILSPTC